MFTTGRKKYQSIPDQDLILAFKADDAKRRAVVSEIYRRYGHLVMGTAMKYLRNKMDAEDIVMNIFEKLPEKLKNHDVKHVKSWLYMVTKNECLMKLRKKGISTSEIDDRTIPSAKEYDDQKEVQLMELEQAIQELKDEQKQCIELFYLKSKSYQEISDLLTMDVKKVKSAIQNGKRNLKLRLMSDEKKSDT